VLAEIPDRQRALAELRRVLRPGGSLSVSELVTDPDYPRAGTVVGWCAQAGFRLAARYGGLLGYTLNFCREAPSATGQAM
jgi:ubiquinone/menaquinone biosynthesis C-methylase UbiE